MAQGDLDIELGTVSGRLAVSLQQMKIKERLYRAGCKIAAADLLRGMKKFIEFRQRGYEINKTCAFCRKRLVLMGLKKKEPTEGLLIFFCGHQFHSVCFNRQYQDSSADKLLCPVCGGRSLSLPAPRLDAASPTN